MSTVTEDSPPETPTLADTPGQQLAQVRQRRGLSLERIATELHLKAETLAAVEEDAYDRLPSAVFVSGYIRAYARLLQIDPEPLIERFHGLHPNAERPPPRVLSNQTRGVGSGHLIGRLLVLGLALAAIVGLGYWASISDWSQVQPAGTPMADENTDLGPISDLAEPPGGPDPVPATPPAPETPTPLATITADPPSTGDMRSDQAADDPTDMPDTPGPEPAMVPSQESPPTTTLLTMSTQADDAAGEVPPEDPVEVDPLEVDPTTSEPAPSDADPPPPVAAPDQVVLAFSGPCWVDVRDADGKVELFGEMADGDRRELSGRPPFSLIIGNAAAAEVRIGDRPFDLKAIAKGNVARFDLDPADLPGADDAPEPAEPPTATDPSD